MCTFIKSEKALKSESEISEQFSAQRLAKDVYLTVNFAHSLPEVQGAFKSKLYSTVVHSRSHEWFVEPNKHIACERPEFLQNRLSFAEPFLHWGH